MICPLMSKQIMMLNNGTQFIDPNPVECLQDKCGCYSMQNHQCGLIHE